ncbi:MAG: DNA replication/repair protein RecF [Bdellovibrionota bacterium]
MGLKSLQLRSFRNYRELALPQLHPEITVFTGRNGIGKTTILEAISILGSGRTFRNGKNADLIHKGDEAAHLGGLIEHLGLETQVKVRIYPQGKKVFLDEKLAKSTESLLELLPTIVFSPADHRIIDGDSQDRKQFLNRAALNVDWTYGEDSQAYNKVLTQRNRILKDAGRDGWSQNRLLDVLASWDEQLFSYGARLMLRRHYYLSELRPKVAEEYRRISLSAEDFQIAYEPFGEEFSCPETEAEVQEIFRQKTTDSMRRDLASGSTQVGPHKDEILLTLNGNKVKFYGSQGEKRTCALALRLGELALFRTKLKKPPMLLFDDVSSELDQARRQSLVELLQKENTQVLITATELPSTLMGDVGKVFEHLDLNAVGVRD